MTSHLYPSLPNITEYCGPEPNYTDVKPLHQQYNVSSPNSPPYGVPIQRSPYPAPISYGNIFDSTEPVYNNFVTSPLSDTQMKSNKLVQSDSPFQPSFTDRTSFLADQVITRSSTPIKRSITDAQLRPEELILEKELAHGSFGILKNFLLITLIFFFSKYRSCFYWYL